MFYDVFEHLCEIKGVSPTRAVEEMGLARTIATKWKKTGAVPRGKTLKIIADYFGVSESYLLSDNQNQLIRKESKQNVKIIVKVGHKNRHKKRKTPRNGGLLLFWYG